MTEIHEVAARLDKFVREAQRKVSARPAQTEYRGSMRAEAPKEPILEIYEKCLGKLPERDCDALDDILKKMSGAV
jgi:hypothetical protein